MKENDINRSCIAYTDDSGKLRIVELEDVPASEDPFRNKDIKPAPESMQRARELWRQYHTDETRDDDAA